MCMYTYMHIFCVCECNVSLNLFSIKTLTFLLCYLLASSITSSKWRGSLIIVPFTQLFFPEISTYPLLPTFISWHCEISHRCGQIWIFFIQSALYLESLSFWNFACHLNSETFFLLFENCFLLILVFDLVLWNYW